MPLACGTATARLLRVSTSTGWVQGLRQLPFKLSTSWAYKSSWEVQFEKPLLVPRGPSACSFNKLPVCACSLNALSQVTSDCWNLDRIPNYSFDLQMSGKNQCWAYSPSTTWKPLSPTNTFSLVHDWGFLWRSFHQIKRKLEFMSVFSFQAFALSNIEKYICRKTSCDWFSLLPLFCFLMTQTMSESH